MIGSWDVQAALVAALKAADVAGDRIFENVPKGTPKPYVQVGETQVLGNDVQGRDGADEFRTLHIWSEYRGQKELMEIAAAIRAAVHGKPLDVASRGSPTVYVRELRTVTEPDGLTRHGVMTLRIQHFGPQET